MAVIIGLSLALVPLVKTATNPAVFGSGGTATLEYYSGGEYHFLAYSYNTYGEPVQGTALNITFTGPGAPASSAAATNSSGFAAWTARGSPPSDRHFYTLKESGNTVMQGSFPPSAKAGEVNSIGESPLSLVTDPANSSRSDALVVYEGPNGTLPTMYRVFYSYGSFSSGGLFSVNESQMTPLGTPSSFASAFKLPPPPPGTTMTSVAVFDRNGTTVASLSNSVQNVGQYVPPTPEALFTALSSSILSLVVPLMAVLVAYNSYGKDKANGVLESVLTRPVTRRGLGVARYVAVLLSIAIALVATMAIMEGISQAMIGKVLPFTFALYTVGALVVEAAAFAGLTMLISHAVRSAGGIIGIGIGLWVVLDFFWGVLMVLGASLLGVQIGSGDYLGLTIDAGFLNPAQYYGLVGQYLNGATISSAGGGIPISPATYGLDPVTLVADAALWVALPLAAFLYLAVRRD